MGKVTAFLCISKYNTEFTQNILRPICKYTNIFTGKFCFHSIECLQWHKIYKKCAFRKLKKVKRRHLFWKMLPPLKVNFSQKLQVRKKPLQIVLLQNFLFLKNIKSWRNSRKLGNSLSWPFHLQFWKLEPDHQVWRNASSTRPRRTYPTFRPRKGHSGMSTINIKATPPSASSTCANENLINITTISILFLFISRIPHLIKSSIIS